MKPGAGTKIFIVSVVLILLSVVGADLVLERGVTLYLSDMARQDLYVRSKLVSRELADVAAPLDDLKTWNAAATNLSGVTEARITIIRADGVVIGDSEETLDGLAKMENHGTRPEVAEALATGRGEDIRDSKTIQIKLMYVAVPLARDGKVAAVVRCSQPLSIIQRATKEIEGFLFIGSAVALVLAMVLSALVRRAS